MQNKMITGVNSKIGFGLGSLFTKLYLIKKDSISENWSLLQNFF